MCMLLQSFLKFRCTRLAEKCHISEVLIFHKRFATQMIKNYKNGFMQYTVCVSNASVLSDAVSITSHRRQTIVHHFASY